jgi:hypothetical protein
LNNGRQFRLPPEPVAPRRVIVVLHPRPEVLTEWLSDEPLESFLGDRPMRIIVAIPLFMLVASPVLAEPPPGDPSPAALDRNEADWAEREAQARITDGDYEGAVEAQRQADADRRAAERCEMIARAGRR